MADNPYRSPKVPSTPEPKPIPKSRCFYIAIGFGLFLLATAFSRILPLLLNP
jgi:hypothetical protein